VARLTREESRALTRAKLLASAREVVAREGYEGASVDRIAEEAGFSKGAFYSNFSSKEEIFLELLETHSMHDVTEIAELLEGVSDPRQMIEVISDWASARSSDTSWGFALELFRHARREATFSDRHATLFRGQWAGIGKILMRMFPEGAAPADPETLGGLVCELTYGGASGYMQGPAAGDLVRLVLMALYEAYGREKSRMPALVARGTRDRQQTRRRRLTSALAQ
jgi:AcrR family transcriptional regulator